MPYILAILYTTLAIVNVCRALPRNITRCHFGDEKCIINSMNYVIQNFPKGIPELGLKPIDVVDIMDTQLLSDDPVGAFWANANLTKQVNYGFENTTITHVAGFLKKPTASHITISGRIPNLVHKGHFIAIGRLWLIDLNSTGESFSEFQNLHFTLNLKVITEFRNNKRYLKVYELRPIVKIDRWILWMDGLFTDNTDLTITLNRLFNERWIEIWNEWEPSILNTFAGVFLGMIKDTLEKNSYDDMFLPDGE